MKKFMLSVILLLLSSPAWSQSVLSEKAKPTPCTDFGLSETAEGIECFRVDVPVRHDAPEADTISLAVARIAPLEGEGPSDPLFMAQGGPGGATIATYAEYLQGKPEARPTQNREIVLWDQRGTGFSLPLLTCPEYREAELTAAMGDDSADETSMLACGERLRSEGFDLSAFNSVENARDVEALRQVFGYDEINFYGVSYGSELAQFVIREVPAVRAAILDAVVPIAYDLLYEPARAQQMIGERYLLGCKEDARCNEAFPNLAERYLAMIDRLNKNPVDLTIYPREGERNELPVRLTGDLLEDVLFSALYGNVSSIVPLIIHQADQGDFALLASVLLPSQLGSSTIAEAMHFSVVCAELSKSSAPPDLSDVLPRLVAATRESAEMQMAVCRAWDIEQLPVEQVAPVRSDKPILLISGAFDPITPPVYGDSLLPQFPEAQHVVFPGGTHGQVVRNVCASGLVAGFLDDPASPVDTSCVPASAPEILTDDDVVFLAFLNRSISGAGILGVAQAGLAQIPALVVGLVLLIASLGYLIVWAVRRIAGWSLPARDTGHGFALHAPPWMTLLSGIAILGSVAALSAAVGTTLMQNEYLGLMGAVPKTLSPLLATPWVVVALALAMLVIAVQLWRHHLRSVLGRLGFTLFGLVTAFAAANLVFLVQ